jgi:ubiquinone/menaquinone biosynthesis C-methylase UbiE
MPRRAGRLRTYPREYWDQVAPRWDQVVRNPSNPHRFYYQEADLLISRALSSRMCVLELGCGTGGSTQIHVREVRAMVVTDFARGMVVRARRRFIRSQRAAKLRFACCDARWLPFRNGRFDAVISRGVMMSYVDDPRRVLSEIHRILQPRGIVAFDVMNDFAVRSKHTGGLFMFFGRTPTYFEVGQNHGLQVRRMFSLPRTTRFLKLARARKRTSSRPKGLERDATSVERYEARLFRPADVKRLLRDAGFRDIRLTPLGHLAHLSWKDDPDLRRLVRTHRASLPKLAVGLADHLKPETALHWFVTARK